MRLELTGRQVTVTPAIRALVEQRLERVLRLLNDSAVSAQVVLTREKSRDHAEVTLHVRGNHFFHGEATGRDVAAAMSAAADKIERQAQKLKGKWKERKRRSLSAGKAAAAVAVPEPAAPRATPATKERAAKGSGDGFSRRSPVAVRVIKARRYEVRPMSLDEAALEVADSAETFLVFRNATTDAITVLFRRPDGHLGLIEPEA